MTPRLVIVVLMSVTVALSLQASEPTASTQNAERIVRGYLDALRALDAARQLHWLAPSYVTESDGQVHPYNRSLTHDIAAWERGMRTRWAWEIIGADGNRVTARLTEESDYFTLLGLGRRTQVTTYTVEADAIVHGASRVVVERHGTQREALTRFRAWLDTNRVSDPDLLDPATGNLRFTGASAPKMKAWLEKWARQRRGE